MTEQPGLGFAGLLRRLRAEAGLTQEELAEAASLSPRSVSDLERGIHRTAHRDTAGLLADALGLAEPVRVVFVAAARGRRPATEVLAARQGQATGASALQNNLPAQLSRFIGRDRELAEVRVLVESSRLVTLTGAGGCGKDGMPLAIELAAARLRSLSLSELHDRLDQRFWLLTGGSRTALERQQTLRATVDWSYSLLNTAEQLLLRRLSVFAGSFDLAAAEGVCGFGDIEVFEVAGLVGSLVDKSLVVAEPAFTAFRYRLLETIRLFAAGRLAETGNEAAAVTAAHCAHFLSVAEVAAAHLTGPDQGSWLARLHADQANLRRAAGHAASRPDGTKLVLRLGVALDRYWRARSREQEALGLLVPVLQRPDARADPALFGAALVTAARAAQFIDVSAARQFAEQAVEVARRLGDDRLLINSLATVCAAYFFAGEPEAGLPFGQESVERARSIGDDVLLGRSLMSYLTTFHAIDLARSLPLYAEAIACTERSGDHLINSFVRDGAGGAALEAGDIPAARAHVEAAVQAAQQIGWVGPAAAVTLGLVQRAEGDPGGARSTFEAGLRISRRNGDKLIMAEASLGLACLAGDAGDWDRAAALHGVAQAFIDRTGSPWQEFDARYRQDSLAQARAHLGDEQLERACAQGMALSLEKALDLALPGAGSA